MLTESLHVRVSSDLRRKLELVAQRGDVSPSWVVRSLIKREVERVLGKVEPCPTADKSYTGEVAHESQ